MTGFDLEAGRLHSESKDISGHHKAVFKTDPVSFVAKVTS